MDWSQRIGMLVRSAFFSVYIRQYIVWVLRCDWEVGLSGFICEYITVFFNNKNQRIPYVVPRFLVWIVWYAIRDQYTSVGCIRKLISIILFRVYHNGNGLTLPIGARRSECHTSFEWAPPCGLLLMDEARVVSVMIERNFWCKAWRSFESECECWSMLWKYRWLPVGSKLWDWLDATWSHMFNAWSYYIQLSRVCSGAVEWCRVFISSEASQWELHWGTITHIKADPKLWCQPFSIKILEYCTISTSAHRVWYVILVNTDRKSNCLHDIIFVGTQTPIEQK